jgi:hypothetical protein
LHLSLNTLNCCKKDVVAITDLNYVEAV